MNAFAERNGLALNAFCGSKNGETDRGADRYDAFTLADGSIIVASGDMTGDGIGAAPSMMQLWQCVRAAATIGSDPAAILRTVDEKLFADRSGCSARVFIGTIAPDCRTLRYASAGYPDAFLRAHDSALTTLAGSSPALGTQRGAPFDVATVTLDGPAMLVLYSDGLTAAASNRTEANDPLRAVLASQALDYAANPARFIVRAAGRIASRDDAAILTVRFGTSATLRGWDVSDPAAANDVKGEAFECLRDVATFTEEQEELAHVVFNELVGNVVRHAPGALSVSLAMEGDRVCLHMIDDGPGFDRVPELPTDIWAESGRGLFLISQLAEDLTVERLPQYGTHVAVRLRTEARTP